MDGYRDLLAWKKSYELTKEVYAATRSFPVNERYGLVSQMRRATLSIPSNIAAGYGRDSPRDHNRFVQIALGSACELQTQTMLAKDVGLLPVASFEELWGRIEEVLKLLYGLSRYLGKQGSQ